MVRALVTGGAGFLASHLVDRLIWLGHEVTVYDKVDPHRSDCSVVVGDLRAGESLRPALAGRDIVFHFAANADVRGGTYRPTFDLEQNLLATSLLLEHMRQANVKRIVFASTAVVYGEPKVFPTPENAPFPIQTSFYGASKVAAEGLIGAYCHGFGIQATIFRFAPVLGERYKHGHVFDFWRKLQADPTHIEILGDGKQRKSYVYVGDVIDAIACTLRSGEAPVEIFNVGGPSTCTVDQSLDWICEELGLSPKRTYTGGVHGWPGDPPYILLDTTRLKALGWVPKVPMKEAVQRTVRSFL